MRLWSLNPEYLDRQGLLALWREGLLARKVLLKKTRGYRQHPQLRRFKEQADPLHYIDAYLAAVCQEATNRGYLFDQTKIQPLKKKLKDIKVNTGQIKYEFQHLLNKLKIRDRGRYDSLINLRIIKAHPIFKKVKGGVEGWEKIK